MFDRVTGMDEVARQIRIARRLYEVTWPEADWNELSFKERRPFIDQACQGPNRDDNGHNCENFNGINFVALDFETANADLNSICQVGTVEFRDEVVVNTFSSLVDPQDYFSEFNMRIHGISPESVIGAPNFEKIYPELVQRLSGKVLVSHTPFDHRALCKAITQRKLPEINCRWLDSTRVVRRTWLACAKKGYGLPSIASRLGIEFQHHDALEDARTVGLILVRAIAESGISLEDWMGRSLLPIRDKIRRIGLNIDSCGALFGEHVVFTGALTIPRREAEELAAHIGCIVSASVTKKTSLLVTGDQDISRLSIGQTKSSKRRSAEALIKQGSNLRIIGESDFMALCIAETRLIPPFNLAQHHSDTAYLGDILAFAPISSA